MLKHNENGLVVTWKTEQENRPQVEIYTSVKKFTDLNPEFKYNSVAGAVSWREKKRYETDAVLIIKAPVV